MKTPENNRYAVQLSLTLARALPVQELEQLAQCVLFVATSQPPRVGTSVELVLTLNDEAPVTLPAMVVWSRPGRPGTAAGFRAQLKAAPAGLPDRLRDLAQQAYVAASKKPAASQGELVVEERVTSRDITSPMRNGPRSASIPPPTRPPVLGTAAPAPDVGPLADAVPAHPPEHP